MALKVFSSGSTPELSPALFFDASGTRVRIGILNDEFWAAYRESESQALAAIFGEVEAVLDSAKITWPEIQSYLYVEGPGSVLGLRIAAMAIRAWQVEDAKVANGASRPVFSCNSLQLAAALASTEIKPPFAVFTEARHGHWHVLEIAPTDLANPCSQKAREVGENDLPGGPLYHIQSRKAWHKPPARAQALAVSLEKHPEALRHRELLRRGTTATPYTGTSPEYKKWAGATKV